MNQYSHFAIEETDVIRPQSDVDANQWKLLRRLLFWVGFLSVFACAWPWEQTFLISVDLVWR